MSAGLSILQSYSSFFNHIHPNKPNHRTTMTKFCTNNPKSVPQSAGHKRSRPLSSFARLPSLSTLVISEQEDSASSSKGKIFLTPRKAEFRKGWGSFKSRQRYVSLLSLEGNSTVSSTASHSASLFSTSPYDDASASTGGSGSHLSLCSSTSSTTSTPLIASTMSENESDTAFSLDAWGFFADV